MKIDHKIPYSKMGYWRIGGPIKKLVTLQRNGELKKLLEGADREDLSVIGNGSNLLLSDRGTSGTTVLFKGDYADFTFEGNQIICGAGLKNTLLLRKLRKLNIGGFGALAGVPGTIGGAIRMNAGTALGEVSDRLIWVDWVDSKGILRRSNRSDLNFEYRHAPFPKSAIIVRASFSFLTSEDKELVLEQKAIDHHLERRKQTQPLKLPSCGSVFTNPKGDYAGRLIDSCGLKGFRIGDAQISEKHANFMVNLGSATALDMYDLIATARRRVFAEHGVSLTPEVQLSIRLTEEI